MAVTYGYFNSINGDRKYNADQMSDYFRGIVNEGVFQHLNGGLAVVAGTGMEVTVATGRAIVQNKWVQNDAAFPLTIEAASDTYGRKDAVVIRLSYTNRAISIVVKTGTPSTSPAAPSLTRSSTTYEMALAYVNVSAGATSVTVTDKRSDTSVCGWATVAQETSGEVDAMLEALKTGFDGVVYNSPAAMVQGEDEKIYKNANSSMILQDLMRLTADNIIDYTNGVTVTNEFITADFGSDGIYRYYEFPQTAVIKVIGFKGYFVIGKGKFPNESTSAVLIFNAGGSNLAYVKPGTNVLNVISSVSIQANSDYYIFEILNDQNIKITAANGTSATIDIKAVAQSDYMPTFGVCNRNTTSSTLYYEILPYAARKTDTDDLYANLHNNSAALTSSKIDSSMVESHLLGISFDSNSIIGNFGTDDKYRYCVLTGIGTIKLPNFTGYLLIGIGLFPNTSSKAALIFNGGGSNLAYVKLNDSVIQTISNVQLPSNSDYICEIIDNTNIKITAANGQNVTIDVASVAGSGYTTALGFVNRNITSRTYNYELFPMFMKNTDGIPINHYAFNNGDLFNAIDVNEKITEYTDIIENGNIENFIFYTDQHLETPSREDKIPYYMTYLQKYYNYAPVDFIVSGGDWLVSNDTISEAKRRMGEIYGYTETMFNGNHHLIVGNHDTNYLGYGPGGETYEGEFDPKTIIGLWYRKEKKAYYSFDGTNTKIYILDTGVIDTAASLDHRYDDVMTAYRWEQIDWLAKKLIEDDPVHSAIMMHMYTDAGIKTLMTNNVAAVISAYNNRQTVTLNEITYDFTSCDGHIEFVMAGHTHSDANDKIDTVPVIVTAWFYNDGEHPLFDLVSADYTARRLYCIRVGTGNNRTFNLDTGNIIS